MSKAKPKFDYPLTLCR